jgi:V8-like Glu-specific endopeptidase
MNHASPYLRRLVAARTRAKKAGLAAESVKADDVGAEEPPHTDDVLGRVEGVMRHMPADDIRDPDEFERALKTFLHHADRGLRTLDRDPWASLDRDASFAVEAVIRTDGTRPSLLVKNGTVDPDHPLARDWRDTLFAVRDKLRGRIAAVGRVEPATPGSNNFFGTGWLVDKGKGLVLTNLHVLEAMWRRMPNAMLKNSNGSFRVLEGAAFVDFAAESGSLVKKRFRITEATPSGIDGSGFARLDAAVLRIEPIAGDNPSPALPEPIPVISDTDGPQGNLTSFAVIGFPGPPPFTSGVHEGVDWMWVNATLFGGRFAVKRLAPGQAHKPLGTLAGDSKPWVFGHDATTLGGSSGSVVLAWLNQDTGGFGLHFAGASLDTNCAHAIAQIQDRLKQLGVPVQNPH